LPQETFFPYQTIGLRANPFRALTRAEWERLAFLPPDVEQAYQTGGCMQILGEKGQGKTSALLALRREADRQGLVCRYEYLSEGVRRFSLDLQSLDVALLDEAQRLTGRELSRLVKAVKRTRSQLVLATHTDVRRHFMRQAIPIRTLQLKVNLEGTRRLVTGRLLNASQQDNPTHSLSAQALAYLVEQFPTYREMQAFLYEVFVRLPPPGLIERGLLREVQAHINSPSAEG